MAVYTPLTRQDIEAFLAQYAIGELSAFKGITEGIENTNYLVTTGGSKYILTLFEARVEPADVPFFLKLTEWLADRWVRCPRPIRGRDGQTHYMLKGKPAALIEYLDGRGNPHITPRHLELVGELAARLHLGAKNFPMTRACTMGLKDWRSLFEKFRAQADNIYFGLEKAMAAELDYLERSWPKTLPSGIIHADMFPDNVFFIDGNTDKPELSGVIDFYFACNDVWMYELAVILNAWCFDTGHHFVPPRAEALLAAYDKVRPITPPEREALPLLARGAAMRFLVTRAYDWLNRPAGALVNPKDPLEYVAKLHFHQRIKSWRDYGL